MVCMVMSQPCPGVGKTALVVVAVQGAQFVTSFRVAPKSDCRRNDHLTGDQSGRPSKGEDKQVDRVFFGSLSRPHH